MIPERYGCMRYHQDHKPQAYRLEPPHLHQSKPPKTELPCFLAINHDCHRFCCKISQHNICSLWTQTSITEWETQREKQLIFIQNGHEGWLATLLKQVLFGIESIDQKHSFASFRMGGSIIYMYIRTIRLRKGQEIQVVFGYAFESKLEHKECRKPKNHSPLYKRNTINDATLRPPNPKP